MKIVILYVSTHHGNTKKIVEKMAASVSAETIDLLKNKAPDISGYDLVGFASGVYAFDFHKMLHRYVDNTSFREGQKVFFVDTCGLAVKDYSKPLKKKLAKKGVQSLGTFQCRGYDTFAIFGAIGGIAKGHPNKKDFKKAAAFIRKIAL